MAAELTLGLELETGAWSFWRTEEQLRFRRGWPQENSGWTFQVGRPAGRLCARGSGVLLGRARAAATTQMRAGWEPEPWGGHEQLAARPSFHVSLGPKVGSGAVGSGSAGRPAQAREGQVRGAARGLTTLGSTRGPAGSRRLQEEVLDCSRTHFLEPD